MRGQYQNAESSSNPGVGGAIVPKPEIVDFDDAIEFGDNHAGSSSSSHVRSFFTGMGFLPSLVDKVIEDNGQDNVDLLLEVLMDSSDPRKPNHASDSMDNLFDENKAVKYSTFIHPKEEPDVFGFDDGKRASLLQMNFSLQEVDFAMEKLGWDAPIDEIIDFIAAAQVAINSDGETDVKPKHDAKQNNDISNEVLFGTMETTLKLLEMGFSESEISLAIERFGSEVPVLELANSICAEQAGEKYIIKTKYPSKYPRTNSSHFARDGGSFKMEMGNNQRHDCRKPKNHGQETIFRPGNLNLEEIRRGKRPKQEYDEDYCDTQDVHFGYDENYYEGEESKPDYSADFSFSFEPSWVEEKVQTESATFSVPRAPKSNSSKSVDQMVAKPPFFFYGNVATISLDSWAKISQFLYAVDPEFVDTRYFSALIRREGYVHNLPSENRFHILPSPPMSIEDAMPHTKKWWPSWDSRRQLSVINCETNGVSKLCDRLGRMLTDCRGLVSSQQKREILYHCHKLNLVWIGPYKVQPMGREHLELILGYPFNHTQAAECSLTETLHMLRYSFQIDTLAYHLSALKSIYPEGITMLSLFSGIGGAEVALHRLGIHMKGVVSVETSESKRKVLRTWWRNSKQTGELEQIEDIQKLTTSRIDKLIEKFGGFDFIICQSPCTFASGNHKVGQDGDGFDFSLFCEFVRVLQRVRNLVQRRSN